MNIELIKWGCQYAEEFEYKRSVMVKSLGFRDTIEAPDGNIMVYEDFDSKEWITLYYPLFLQRVIEGVNKNDNDIVIVQDDNIIAVVSYSFEKEVTIEDSGTPDQAKEAALIWIMERYTFDITIPKENDK